MKPRVLAFCNQNIPTVQVGVSGPLAALSRAGALGYRFLTTPEVNAAQLAQSDILICVRGSEARDLEIVSEALRLGKFVVYYLDDDLFDVPASASCHDFYRHPETRERMTTLLRLANCVWVVNRDLQERLRPLAQRTLRTNAPALLLEAAGASPAPPPERQGGPVTVGYAGGIDHKDFLQGMLEYPVRKLAEEFKDRVRFEFFGARPGFISQTPALHLPYQKDFTAYARVMLERRWEIALAPLPQSPFHASKYYNKYMEYGAIRAAGIYSRVEPYLEVFRDGVNGVLVENEPERWYEAIKKLVLDPDGRRAIAANAQRDLAGHYTPEAIGADLLGNCPEFGVYQAPPCTALEVRLSSRALGGLWQRGFELLKREKLRALPLLVKRIKIFMETGY